MNAVTLLDGREVSSSSEEWRHECEARQIARGATLEIRRAHLAAVEKRRGLPARKALEETIRLLWEAARAAKAAEPEVAA